VTRYTAVANAYAQLRTAWGRSEAYADLAGDQPNMFGEGVGARRHAGELDVGLLGMAALLPARIWHGRPRHLAFRALITALLSLVVVNLLPGQPSGPAVVTGLVTWFLLTGRGDLAPPSGR
jgi:hypothetical protein